MFHKIIDKYVAATASSYRIPTILDVWEVNRHKEVKPIDSCFINIVIIDKSNYLYLANN